MGAVVLVHGAMHGGWCWAPVADRLRAAGHRVLTPTLTGQGDGAHLLTPEVGLATHVEDVERAVWFEGVDRVTLVLHSYAGVLAGPLADRLGSRLATVVAAGAFLVAPGECLLDAEPPETAERYRSLVAGPGEGWRVPASDAFLDQWGVTDPDLRAFVAPRLTDFPARCLTDPADYDADALRSVRRVYVEHTAPPLPSLGASVARARSEGWEMLTVAAGHDLMLAAPGATADLLLDLVGGQR